MEGGVFRYDTDSAEWYQFSATYLNDWITDIVFSGNNVICSAWDGLCGLFISSDNGKSWKMGLSDTLSITVEDIEPVTFELLSFPNPFNANVTIQYTIETPDNISITVYNILGQRVDTVFKGFRDMGTYNTQWNASDFSSGLYIVVLRYSGHFKSIKTTLIR